MVAIQQKDVLLKEIIRLDIDGCGDEPAELDVPHRLKKMPNIAIIKDASVKLCDMRAVSADENHFRIQNWNINQQSIVLYVERYHSDEADVGTTEDPFGDNIRRDGIDDFQLVYVEKADCPKF